MFDQLHSVIKLQRFLIGFAVIIFIAAGCTSRRFVVDKEKSKGDEVKGDNLTLAQYEATLNPSDYDQEIEIVEKTHLQDNQQQSVLDIPKDTMVVQEEVVQGFRIQVFSSSGVDEANLVKSLVQEKFIKDTVYVEYDAPVYKVRVGDFVNRYEASQRLPEFVEKGYRDAWIVPDRIIQRKLVRVPLPK
jgi:hypothetical protein